MIRQLILTLCAAFTAGPSAVAQVAEKRCKVYLVSNAHLDTQWNWDVKTTINKYIPKTLDQNLWLIRRYPNYVFNFEGGIKYHWMKEYYPERFNLVKEAVKSGQWHISGSTWDANDTNIPSTESVFRNILLGQEFFQKEFGVKSTDIFLPDCFGFGYTLPSIMAHCSLIGFSTQKLNWRKNPFYGTRKEPFSIGLWQGIDGSRVMCAFDCGNYVYDFPGDDLSKTPDLLTRAKRGVNGTAYRYYGDGDMGGSPSIGSVETLEKALKSPGSDSLVIISATSDQLYKDYLPYEAHPELPVFDGELLMDVHATGCYTSQGAMKRFNRRNEQLADAAERASVIAHWCGGFSYPQQTLNEAWKRFLWHQFHDDLTGTSIPAAYAYSWNDELLSQRQFADVIRYASAHVIHTLDTDGTGIPLVVYNPVACERRSVVEAFVPVSGKNACVCVSGPDGKPVPTQMISTTDSIAHIAFVAHVEPQSYSVFNVEESRKSSECSCLKASPKGLENDVYEIGLDENGDIASIFDKRYGRELVESGKRIRLALFLNNESNEWPAWEIQKTVLDSSAESIRNNVRISVEAIGPVFASVKIERTFGNSRFVQRIRLTDGASDDRIDIISDIDWASKSSLLKAEFPLSVANPDAVYDVGLGYVNRGNNTPISYEVYAHHWADLFDPAKGYGVAVLTDCKYGWDKPSDNVLRLTLLHTPGTEYRYPHQRTQDFGHHTMTYSIVGHNDPTAIAGLTQKGDELNQPLIPFLVSKHSGINGKKFSFVRSDSPAVSIKMLKKTEHGDDYVLRVYENRGTNIDGAQISFVDEIEFAEELNGLEEPVGNASYAGNTLYVDLTRFQPKTFRIRLKKSGRELFTAVSEPLPLDYDCDGISPDGFAAYSDFDGKWNSYSADLLPDTLCCDGVNFVLGQAGRKNVLKCHGNAIALPKDSRYTKLHVLAAATDRDRSAVFKIGAQEIRLEIPYYSGFYGQWGLDGFSEGYVKEAMPVFVGTHRHSKDLGNEAYVFTYIFKYELDIPEGADVLYLPDDSHIAVFAISAARSATDDVRYANEIRALPDATCRIEYEPRNSDNLAEGASILKFSNPTKLASDRFPQMALDGNLETMWEDNYFLNPNASKFLEIDLDGQKKLRTWKILHGGNPSQSSITRDFKILIRRDLADAWIPVVSISGNEKIVSEGRFPPGIVARYVKFEISCGNQIDNSTLAIREFVLSGE